MKDLRERVEELRRGEFKNSTPKIEISPSFIEINLNVGEHYEGYISLKSINSNKMKGIVYTSTYRMQCKNSQFIGKEAKIWFEFNAKGICEGKCIKGKFYIVSNGGEFSLPFVVQVTKKEINSSMGKINNLFHFTNLAVSNWNEAFKVFKMPEFINIFINNDKRYENLYMALTSGEMITEQCMEEFLIGIHKKNPIQIQVEELEKSFYQLVADEEERIQLNKNTWGYVNINVSVDCDFIEIDKKVITTDDFIGSTYSLGYIIKKNKLHAGRNYGRIYISSINSEIIYEIVASTGKNAEISKERIALDTKKKSFLNLTRLYISYRCKKTNKNQWVKECMKDMNTLLEQDPDNRLYKLIYAQFLIFQKKSYEGFIILKEFEQYKKEIKEDIRLYVFYLYLTTFWHKEKKYLKKVVTEVREIYRKHKDWHVLWVLLYLDQTYQSDILQKFNMIEEEFSFGADTPIMYAEAYQIMKSDVLFIRKLGKFEIQVLWWAVKNKILTREVAIQTANLTIKIKEFNNLLFQILVYSYEQYQEKEILSAICRILIHGNRIKTKYFEWYKLGVEQDVRITRLYEYYMYSIPIDYNDNIPKAVLMYFGYHNNLDYKKSALLYERVIKQRDIYPEIFQNYRRNIEEYMLEQLILKHNNEKLAFIYDTMLSINSITLDIANSVSDILFDCELYCDNPRIKSVAVVHKHFKGQKLYPVINHIAHIQVFSKAYEIAFLDGEGNRYLSSISYKIKNLMDEAYYIKKCFELNVNNKNVKFYIEQNLIDSNLITDSNLEILMELIQEDCIKESYKKYLRGIVINYCFEYDEDSLTKFIVEMDLSGVDCYQRQRAIEYLIMKGIYQQAYEEMIQYGFEDISVNQLIKLTSRLIYEREYEENQLLLSLAFYVFDSRKYDEVILKYLIKYFNGPVSKLRDIWNAAYRFDLDSYELSERILLQILFTNEYIEEIDDIFEYYYNRGSRFQITQAFITYYSYLFLVEDKKIGHKIFEYIKREQYLEELFNDTCKLAMLKYYSGFNLLSDKERKYVENTLKEFMNRKVYFKFYEQFDERILEPYCFEGKYIVEYKSDTGNRIFIHFIQEDMTGSGEYKVEEMRQSYLGIYYKVFTVFYGEKVHYYITEENNQKDLVKNDIIVKNGMNLKNSNSRYNMLNDMSVAMEMNDDITLLELMNKYAVRSQAVDKLFNSI